MFMFVRVFPDATTHVVALGGIDLAAAFDEYRRYHWLPTYTAAAAVWMNAALVARVVSRIDEETGDALPVLQEWK